MLADTASASSGVTGISVSGSQTALAALDGKKWSLSSDGTITIIDQNDEPEGQPLPTYPPNPPAVRQAVTAQGSEAETGVPPGDKVYLVKNGNTIEVWDAPTGGNKVKTIIVTQTVTDSGTGADAAVTTDSGADLNDVFQKIQMTCSNNNGIDNGVVDTAFAADSCPSGHIIKTSLSSVICS